ncbi:Hok/Gef family protein, partial [Franconibacter helveticus]|uniref:Hok/Gef family protein n=2 Tax=Franconibacter helveticus TaxID=357240 RepID=UPI0039C8558D
GCLRLSVLSIREGQKEKSPGHISINPRLSLNSTQVEISQLLAARQGVKGMKPLKYRLAYLLIICITVLLLSLFYRDSLCEIKIKHGVQEVAAKLACSEH